MNCPTHLDGHSGDVETVRKEDPLAQHAMIPRSKLNLGYRECVSEVQRAVHVRKGKVAEPFREFLLDLCGGESSGLLD